MIVVWIVLAWVVGSVPLGLALGRALTRPMVGAYPEGSICHDQRTTP